MDNEFLKRILKEEGIVAMVNEVIRPYGLICILAIRSRENGILLQVVKRYKRLTKEVKQEVKRKLKEVEPNIEGIDYLGEIGKKKKKIRHYNG